jgi:hypothetical protein
VAQSLRASLKTRGDGLLKAEGLDGDAVFLHVEPLLRDARRSLGRDQRRKNGIFHPSRHVFDWHVRVKWTIVVCVMRQSLEGVGTLARRRAGVVRFPCAIAGQRE